MNWQLAHRAHPAANDGDVSVSAERYKILQGDALEVLRAMPSESVHMCVTSPPYFGLRDYGTGLWDGGKAGCDHQQGGGRDNTEHLGNVGTRNEAGDAFRNSGRYVEQGAAYGHTCGKCGAVRQDHQMGLEASPSDYLERMVRVFAEVKRVMRRDSTLWLNLGDSYAGGPGGAQGGTGQSGRKPGRTDTLGLKPKDLMMMPARLAIALCDDGWWLRQEICWVKKSPMPESVTDRFTSATEKIYLLAKSANYYFDAEAVKEPSGGYNGSTFTQGKTAEPHANVGQGERIEYPTRNMRNAWILGPEPFPEAHFATFVTEIPRRCILAGTSARGVCASCGAPWRRTIERERQGVRNTSAGGNGQQVHRDGVSHDLYAIPATTTGWTPTCKCSSAPLCGATVLDPFCGSGTTLMVALRHGRRAVGIELNQEYIEMAHRRIEGDERAMQQHMTLEEAI